MFFTIYIIAHDKKLVNIIYKKTLTGEITMNNPTKNLRDYLSISGVVLPEDIFELDEQNNQNVELPKQTVETL